MGLKKIQIFSFKIFLNINFFFNKYLFDRHQKFLVNLSAVRPHPRLRPPAHRLRSASCAAAAIRPASASVTTPRPRVHAQAFTRPEHYSRAQSIIHAPKREFHVKQTFSYSKKKQKFLHNDIYILLDFLHSIFIFYNTICILLLF